jgi:hypothetical protein
LDLVTRWYVCDGLALLERRRVGCGEGAADDGTAQ